MYKLKVEKELGRIRQNKNSTFLSHPVHYLVQGTQINALLDVSHDIVRTLNENRRLCSYRVNFVGYNNQELEVDQEDFQKI